MNAIGYRAVTWIGRGALILAGLLTLGAASGGNPFGVLVLVVFPVLVPIAGVCAALKARMLERRLAQLLMHDGSDTAQQTHAIHSQH